MRAGAAIVEPRRRYSAVVAQPSKRSLLLHASILAWAAACQNGSAETDGGSGEDGAHPQQDGAVDASTHDAPPEDSPADAPGDGGTNEVIPNKMVKGSYTCTTTVGSGSGMLTIAQGNLKSGDVVCVKAGTYTGADLSNLNGLVIIPAGPVIFTGSMNIHNTVGVKIDGTVLPATWYGLTFSGYKGFAFETGATNNQDLTIRGFLLDNVSGVDGNNQGFITYTGSVSTLLFSNLTLDVAKVHGAASLFAGTYQGPSTYHNVTIGLNLTNIVVVNDGTGSTTKVNGASVYGFVADGWNISGHTLEETDTAAQQDNGVFMIGGSGIIRNVYRIGGWGWLLRLSAISYPAQTESYFYNIVDIDNFNYGTFDVRTDTGSITSTANGPMPIKGGGVHIYNVTAMNNDTTNTYMAPIAINYGLSDGSGNPYVIEVKNCFAFHNQFAKSYDPFFAAFGPGTVSNSNNLVVNGPLGAAPSGYLVDQTTFAPVDPGPLIGQGVAVPQASTDLYGNPRGSSYDIGAVQH
jgi:hypothetical protein